MRRRRLPLLLLFPAVALGSGTSPFSCPPGTKLETQPQPSQAAQVESCRDPKTGMREGPTRIVLANGGVSAEGQYRADKMNGEFRVYDDAGRLTFVSQYSDGKQLATRATVLGLESIARELNSRAKSSGLIVRWVVRDEQTVEVVTTINRAAESSWDANVVKGRVESDPRMCAMFKATTNVKTVVARYVSEDGKELLVASIPRSRCQG